MTICSLISLLYVCYIGTYLDRHNIQTHSQNASLKKLRKELNRLSEFPIGKSDSFTVAIKSLRKINIT